MCGQGAFQNNPYCKYSWHIQLVRFLSGVFFNWLTAELFSMEVTLSLRMDPEHTIFPFHKGFEASIFTQESLQPSCTDS